jgi:hypothetical protein
MISEADGMARHGSNLRRTDFVSTRSWFGQTLKLRISEVIAAALVA